MTCRRIYANLQDAAAVLAPGVHECEPKHDISIELSELSEMSLRAPSVMEASVKTLMSIGRSV